MVPFLNKLHLHYFGGETSGFFFDKGNNAAHFLGDKGGVDKPRLTWVYRALVSQSTGDKLALMDG